MPGRFKLISAPRLSGMHRRARTAAGLACVLFGLAIPMWFVGSIEWTSGPRSAFQLVLLVLSYAAAGTAILLALYVLRWWIKGRRAVDAELA